jgi:hypothetical protein
VDYKQASEILLVNFASSLRLRQEQQEIEMDVNWNETQRDEGNNASRADLSDDYTSVRKYEPLSRGCEFCCSTFTGMVQDVSSV